MVRRFVPLTSEGGGRSHGSWAGVGGMKVLGRLLTCVISFNPLEDDEFETEMRENINGT